MPELLGERFPHTHEWELEHLFFWLLKADADAATYNRALLAALEKQKDQLAIDFPKEEFKGFYVLQAVWKEEQ